MTSLQHYTAEQVADLLVIPLSEVRRMSRTHELPAIKIGRRWRYRASDLESWLRKRTAS